MISGAYTDSTGERCTAEKRNDLLGREPTTEQVTLFLGVSVPATRAESRLAETIFLESLRTPTVALPRTSANGLRLARRSRSARTDQRGSACFGIATKELRSGNAVDTRCVRDDSD